MSRIWAGGVCVPQELPSDLPGVELLSLGGGGRAQRERGQICPVGSGTVRPRTEGRVAQDGPRDLLSLRDHLGPGPSGQSQGAEAQWAGCSLATGLL